MARIHSDTVDEARVFEGASSQQNLVFVQPDDCIIPHAELPIELVKEFIWLLAFDFGLVVSLQDFNICFNMQEIFGGLFVLQIRFSIQTLGLHIGDTFLEGAIDQNEVAGEKLILVYFDDITDLNL